MSMDCGPRRPLSRAGLPVAILLLPLAACSGDDAAKRKPPTPEVGYVVLKPSSVEDVTELTGRVVAYQISEVRPQVAGLVQRRLFTEGSLVRAGQTLYQIDPRTYSAAAAEARANLASALASEEAARIRADRYRPLAEAEAVSRQEYTDALASARQASAGVQQQRARLASASISLGFTRVPAPISGRIGRTLVSEGALVTANQAEPLAVIQQLDPVYVDVQQSSAALLRLRRELAQGGSLPANAEMRLTLEDGSVYPVAGRIGFSETIVDPATGNVTLRATFRNPQGILLPGMFVRARFTQAINRSIFLVPQQAVSRDPNGAARVMLVDKAGKVAIRKIEAERTQGADWVVTGGLKEGERLIVQGTQRAKPGQKVKAVPASTPERIAPPKKPGG